MNKQSGFNAEQIEKDKYPESKNHLKIKSKQAERDFVAGAVLFDLGRNGAFWKKRV